LWSRSPKGSGLSIWFGDKDLKSTQIDVKTVKGHVVLLGIVSTQGEIQRAIAHAKQVEGVQKIKSFVMIR
jgi:osmotically-inducible protein OsmY